MRLTPSDTVDHVDLNRSFRRPSSSHEERILRGNPPSASFCENFVLAVFSTFSTESAKSRHREEPIINTSRSRSRFPAKVTLINVRACQHQFFDDYFAGLRSA